MDGRRHFDSVDPGGEVEAAVLATKRPTLEQIAQRLLEKERIAARALREHRRDLVRNRGSGRAVGKQPARVEIQRSELDLVEPVREALPRLLPEMPGRMLPLASVEEHERNRLFFHQVQKLDEQLERRLVRPMQVVEHDARRMLFREPCDEGTERVDGLALDT